MSSSYKQPIFNPLQIPVSAATLALTRKNAYAASLRETTSRSQRNVNILKLDKQDEKDLMLAIQENQAREVYVLTRWSNNTRIGFFSRVVDFKSIRQDLRKF